MKKYIGFLILSLMAVAAARAQEPSFHSYTVKDIDGNDYPLSMLAGKKVMVVNVASRCGLTPQYAKLQEMNLKYARHGLVIIAFPANNFMEQEPGTNQ